MAKPWPERPVSAANKSGKQWPYDEKVRQSAHAKRLSRMAKPWPEQSARGEAATLPARKRRRTDG
jgi:hypothetical protein